MKNLLISITCGAVLLLNQRLCQGQETKPAESNNAIKQDSPAAGNTQLNQDEMEQKFKTTMTRATMAGRWCSIKDGLLGPSKEDKYTIVGVSKIHGDSWIISARVQYGQKDFVAPIPVQVKWAGDTPVIIVDKLPMPGGGIYSARVMVYEHTYAGSWSGGDHGGLLNGVIIHETQPKPAEVN